MTKRDLVFFGGLAMLVAGPAMAQAQPHAPQMHGDVVARGHNGQATQIRVDGRVYDVCTRTRTDECINPREAGLNFGNAPLDHWPGEPASLMHQQAAAKSHMQPAHNNTGDNNNGDQDKGMVKKI